MGPIAYSGVLAALSESPTIHPEPDRGLPTGFDDRLALRSAHYSVEDIRDVPDC
jgi:hypothetical protein